MSKETRSELNGDSIDCPKCGKLIDDLADLELYGDQENTDTECPHCETMIKVLSRVSRTYIATVA